MLSMDPFVRAVPSNFSAASFARESSAALLVPWPAEAANSSCNVLHWFK